MQISDNFGNWDIRIEEKRNFQESHRGSPMESQNVHEYQAEQELTV